MVSFEFILIIFIIIKIKQNFTYHTRNNWLPTVFRKRFNLEWIFIKSAFPSNNFLLSVTSDFSRCWYTNELLWQICCFLQSKFVDLIWFDFFCVTYPSMNSLLRSIRVDYFLWNPLGKFYFVEYSWCVKYTAIELVRENSLFDACVLYECMFEWMEIWDDNEQK